MSKNKQDLGLSKQAPTEVASDIQKWRGSKGSHTHDLDENEATRTATTGVTRWPDYAVPVGAYDNNPDYLPGPVTTVETDTLNDRGSNQYANPVETDDE